MSRENIQNNRHEDRRISLTISIPVCGTHASPIGQCKGTFPLCRGATCKRFRVNTREFELLQVNFIKGNLLADQMHRVGVLATKHTGCPEFKCQNFSREGSIKTAGEGKSFLCSIFEKNREKFSFSSASLLPMIINSSDRWRSTFNLTIIIITDDNVDDKVDNKKDKWKNEKPLLFASSIEEKSTNLRKKFVSYFF